MPDTMKDRLTPVEGLCNMRDLGGLPCGNGRKVKRGMIYRSEELCDLRKGGLSEMNRLGIKTVVDFRDRGEAAASPDKTPPSVENKIALPIEAGRVMGMFSGGKLSRNNSIGIMVSTYRVLVHDFQEAYSEFFRIVENEANAPILFHCAAGKDRTGLAAALFLAALGVDRETIMRDYMLSKPCLANKFRPGLDYDDALEPLYSVEPEFLRASFEVMDENYGGPEHYVREKLGVDLGKLGRLYTEKA